MFDVAENKSFQFSAALHIGVVLIFLIGLPSIFTKREPQPMVMTVEILPISAVSNVKPSEKPIQKAMTAKQPVKQPPAPTPPTPQKAAAAPPKEAVPVPDQKKQPEAKSDAKESDEKSDAKQTNDFDKLLKDLQKTEEKVEKADPKAKDTVTREENKTKSDAPYDPGKPLSLSQMDMIRSQFIPCWTPPAGAVDAGALAVIIHIALDQSGTVTSAKVDPSLMGRYNSDTFFRAAADAATRAVWKCSPLKNLPPEDYNSWRELRLNFDPSQML